MNLHLYTYNVSVSSDVSSENCTDTHIHLGRAAFKVPKSHKLYDLFYFNNPQLVCVNTLHRCLTLSRFINSAFKMNGQYNAN